MAPLGESGHADVTESPGFKQAWRKTADQRYGSPVPGNGGNGIANGVPDAGPWAPAVQEIVEFQHLGDDWDGQGAQAPSRDMLECAIGLAYTMHQQGLGPPSRVVPGPDGAVIFEWQEPDGTYTEVEIVRPFHADVMMIVAGQPAKHWTLPTD